MDSLINTFVIVGIVAVVIFFIIAASINTVAKQNAQGNIVSNTPDQEK